MIEVFNHLVYWTDDLARGFGFNLLISISSMIVGTSIGLLLGLARSNKNRVLVITASSTTSIFRNIPSFVFMFYIAFILPVEFEFQGELVRFPAWIKASIALSIPVIGFTSDQILRLVAERHKKNQVALPMFLLAWTQYFVIIVMASSTASVIGVAEIVGRANTAIAVIGGDATMMLVMYLYVAAWFLMSGIMINGLMKLLTSSYLKKAKN
jgi:His/Glu/Gln/Arg/opine family amino acid ABC transporter permease subunit